MLDTRFHSGRIDNRLTGQTRYGNVDAAVAISQTFGSNIVVAPISGYLKSCCWQPAPHFLSGNSCGNWPKPR